MEDDDRKEAHIVCAFYGTAYIAKWSIEMGRPISQEYVRRLCKNGTIDAIKPGRDWLVSWDSMMDFFDWWLNGEKNAHSSE